MSEEANYEYKEVTLSTSMTQKGREKILEKEIQKMERMGWIFEEYYDGGLTKQSKAKFKRKIMKINQDTDSLSIKNIIVSLVVILIAYQAYSIFSTASKEDSKRNNEIKQHIYHKRFFDEPLSKLKKLPLYDLQEVSKSYAYANKLDEKKMYDCLGYMVYTKSEDIKTKEILNVCKNDLLNNSKYIYYNKAWLLADFSQWDGSYRPLENYIKENMNDPSSYEHIKTMYSFVLHGKKLTRPYMNVITEYRGKNAYGAIVKGHTTAKVDAKTKEMFDIR